MSEIKPKHRHWIFQMQQNAQILQRPHFHHFCHVVANKVDQRTSVLLSVLISSNFKDCNQSRKCEISVFFRRLDFLGKAGQSQRSDVSPRRCVEPVSTWTRCNIPASGESRCEPRAEPDTGLFMSLSPHRVPDRSHPCQHQRIPSHGDISHCCLLKSCHYIVPCSSVDEFWKIPRWATPRNFSAVGETCATPPPIV